MNQLFNYEYPKEEAIVKKHYHERYSKSTTNSYLKVSCLNVGERVLIQERNISTQDLPVFNIYKYDEYTKDYRLATVMTGEETFEYLMNKYDHRKQVIKKLLSE